ncbi:cytochrome P450 81Q32-like [Impatiens glandulifera]|uniref:cytochrome P450 81Q32-like n=1 Tax=Impatiens glandulifera TaxID=253017 RepID=UPI001FB0808B|nr:cytochrome P450 81Q32-like [Impatiens glandulifera]
MDLTTSTTLLYASLISGLFLAIIFIFLSSHKRLKRNNNPPCPSPTFPVIGHLHLLNGLPHRTLHQLSQKLGPVFSLQLGNQLAVIISSPSAVEECFTKNDAVLANRPFFISGKYFGYNHTTVINAPYGDHWRNLRRLMTVEIMSTSRINSFLSIRQDEVKYLLQGLYQVSSSTFAHVDMRSRLSELSFNVIMRMVAGKRYFGQGELSDYEEAKEFRNIVREVFEKSDVLHPNEFLTILRLFDYGNYEKNLAKLQKKMDVFFQRLIDQRRLSNECNSMIDHLLVLQEKQPNYYTDEIIKGIILVMILAGTDTSSVTLEWALSLLVNHPEVLMKATTEIDSLIGQDRLVDEPDLAKLPYLQGVISDTLRLFPAAPLLLPHMPSEDCKIAGFDVPRGTMLIVNAWAINRDPNVWEEAEKFKPERFEGKKDEKIPKIISFGLGRRACPGEGLAQRIMGLTLASLIQSFQWERVSENGLVDLTEGIGLTMPKAQPLEVMCKARHILHKLFLMSCPHSYVY